MLVPTGVGQGGGSYWYPAALILKPRGQHRSSVQRQLLWSTSSQIW